MIVDFRRDALRKSILFAFYLKGRPGPFPGPIFQRVQMNQIPLHPAIVHLPLGVAVTAPILALALFFAVSKGWLGARAFALLGLLQILALGAGALALNTGEQEEDRLEGRISKAALKAHEERADVFMGTLGVALLLSAAAALWKPGTGRTLVMTGAVVASLASAGMAVATGKAGGNVAWGPAGPMASGAPGPVSPGGGDREGHEEHDD